MRASRVITMGVFLLAAALPAAAQTATPATTTTKPASASPQLTGVEVGVIGGLSAVQNVGGLLGGRIGYAINDKIQIEAEGMWMQDVATRARLEAISSFGTYLTSVQGKPSTATLTAPANYFGGGFKFLIPMDGALHPYVAIGGGMAKVALKPVFTISGTDVTTQLSTYGVTLGSDFTGDVTKAAITGGLGVLINNNRLSFDVGLRLTSIQTDGQKTNVLRGQLGIAYKF